MQKLKTKDGYSVNIYLFNNVDFSCHVFISKENKKEVNSTNHNLFHMHGRENYETLISDCKDMTRKEVIKMFFK